MNTLSLPATLVKGFLLIYLAAVLPGQAYVQAENNKEGRLLLIREAQEFERSTVAVEGYLLSGDILEVKVTARMYGTKPKIYNAIVVGPGLGRLSITSKEVLLASTEEDEPYPTSRKDRGFISFGRDGALKSASGTLTRELLLFKIPENKIRKTGKYRLWIQIMSLQKGSKYKTFKFDLKDLYEKMR
ncbi:MAG: hypothetical protein ABH815_05680 [Candidatus Omnitrophota bacterium]